MFNINRSLKKGVRYPDKELLDDYHGLHFADLISTPAVRAMSGADNTIEFGDSGYWYTITFDLSLISQSRKEKLMEFCDKFAQEIEIALPRMSKKYKDFYQYFLDEKRTSQWHIRRILYFVNLPQEIKNIELDNESSTFDILPVPIIIDGYHRWMAARYLYELGSLHKIHCLYAGREDVLDYLKGKLDTMPQEEIA